VNSPFTDLSTAAAVFVATDIDDLVLLTALFGNARMSRGAIVGGQFLGIAVLVTASAAAAFAALTVPAHWPSLLGAIPLAMGLWKLPALWRGPAADDDAEVKDLASRGGAAHSQVLAVAAVTIANGGDNLAVYVPLFARDPAVLPLYALAFAVMTAVWCAAGHAFVRHPAGAVLMRRWGHAILPVVLIALGASILWDARYLLS